MLDLSSLFNSPIALFLAQEAAAPANPAAPAGGEPPPFYTTLMLWIPLGLLFYLFFMRPAQKQAAQQRDRIDTLKKGDKLVTKGGIYGSVVSVDKEAKRITLKIDEATNTKIDITLTAVDYVINESGEGEKSS